MEPWRPDQKKEKKEAIITSSVYITTTKIPYFPLPSRSNNAAPSRMPGRKPTRCSHLMDMILNYTYLTTNALTTINHCSKVTQLTSNVFPLITTGTKLQNKPSRNERTTSFFAWLQPTLYFHFLNDKSPPTMRHHLEPIQLIFLTTRTMSTVFNH